MTDVPLGEPVPGHPTGHVVDPAWMVEAPLTAPTSHGGLLDVFRRRYVLRLLVRKEIQARYNGSFLGLFWMTAPLAWAYAVPYERLLSPWQATAFNLATLALVALWRVVLMVRVVKVVLNYSWAASICAVMMGSRPVVGSS